MNCSEVQKILSDYYDGELEESRQSQVQTHVASCHECAAQLEAFRQLTDFVSLQPTASPPEPNWGELIPRLASVEGKADLNSSEFLDPLRTRFRVPAWLAIAASILLTLAGTWWVYGIRFHHVPDEQFTAEFDRYLTEFGRDPHTAQQILLNRYQHEPLDPVTASEQLGYVPAVLKGLPVGYTAVSTRVVKMPCCTCVQTVCQRSDGSVLALFEHDDDDSEQWFGDRSARMEQCHNKQCQMVDLDEQFAATWKRGTRHITLIGARDKTEVAQLVSWLDEST